MYLVKMPPVLKAFLGEAVFCRMQSSEKTLFLTFDDGPTPDITSQILDILDFYDVKATFFCIGGNVARHPGKYAEILKQGHAVGNHTWNHMNGWEFTDFSYYKNILECSRVVDSNLFRPPYGKITRQQISHLSTKFKIILWDVISGDWDHTITPEQCLNNVTENAVPGSIIVFHDSEKAKERMLYALPRALAFWKEQGYQFEKISLPGDA